METITNTFRQIDTNKFTLEIYNASEASFGVASVLVSGKIDAVLIDAQFTLADAENVAQHIIESGKNLKAIYVSHGDPDFYFGLEVFKKHFPDVVVFATAATVDHIKNTAQKKLDIWGSRLGKAITSNVVLPQVIKENFIELEDERLEIVGLESLPSKTFIWIPSVKAVVGGINVFGTTFNLWMADAQTPEARTNWIAVLDTITDLNPEIVIPAHASPDSAFNLSAVDHSKTYLEFYENALSKKPDAATLMNVIKEQYPNLTFEIALQIGAKVTTGEMSW